MGAQLIFGKFADGDGPVGEAKNTVVEEFGVYSLEPGEFTRVGEVVDIVDGGDSFFGSDR